ncbi:MAG: ABC-2 family transporter protein, partial [Spirochaetales bacterium]|nr:ABC-2 family transporter protein [Spirochaetales bacterium]
MVKKQTSLLLLYYHNIKNEIARAMQFRADFTVSLITSLAFSIISPITQFLIFRLTNGYPGWSVSEMIVFQGAYVLWTGFRETLFGGVRIFILQVVRKGDLDRILLKPFHSGGFILASGFRFESIGSIAAGIIVLVLAMPATGAAVTISGIIVFLVLIVCGTFLFMGVLLLFCAITVTGIFSGRISELIDRLLDYAGYPSEIYPGISRAV